MTEEAREQGRFEGEVLARLDMLFNMGIELKECLKDQNKRMMHLENDRVPRIEADQKGFRAWAAGAGAAAAVALHFLMKFLPSVQIKP